ncbi:methyl-accepting chemotaxis protein [Kiloniella majae]|uniref:methyl-accepting chemotaxis protein n=1 Tax=Kiloniella majae TaxID=1938558 RepID=UPI000A2792D9|nr:HAMP domain-containing methyl-accepting chemotaxis protein [Kiloniella majae]
MLKLTFFRSAKISLRISLIAVLAVASLVILGGTFFSGDQLVGRAFNDQENNEKLATLTKNIEIGVLQMRRREKDFLLRKDQKYADLYLKQGKEISTALTELASLPAAENLQTEISRLRNNLDQHSQQFEKVVTLLTAMGLDEESGLKGDLRTAVHKVEEQLKINEQEALTIKMLMIRRHEKDFMLRGQDKYINRIADRRTEFLQLLENSTLSTPDKEELTTLINHYQLKFSLWAETHLEAQKEITNLSAIFKLMEPDFKLLFETAGTGLIQAKTELTNVREKTNIITISVGLVLLLSSILLSILITRSITLPLGKIISAMKRLAKGDQTIELTGLDRKDEMGEMSRAVQVFKENSIEITQTRAENAKRREEQAASLKAEILSIADALGQEVRDAVEDANAKTTEMRSASRNMNEIVESLTNRTTSVSTSTGQASERIQAVASASEELSSSIGEITRQVEQSNAITLKAVGEAQSTDTTISELSGAAEKIGHVVNLIQDIAEQTNLLALNATIEAARAGDAGKGFAVVASEVKSLATQTAKATEEISDQVTSIRSETGKAVTAIRSITGTISEVNDIAQTIGDSIEQQDLATREISQNVQETAINTTEASNEVSHLAVETNEVRNISTQVRNNADQTADQIIELQNRMADVLKKLRESAVGNRRSTERFDGPWSAALINGSEMIDVELTNLSLSGAKVSPLSVIPDQVSQIQLAEFNEALNFNIVELNSTGEMRLAFVHTANTESQLAEYIAAHTKGTINQQAVA